MHQAVKAFLANQRQGTAATKTRGFVVGGNQKPWKQKGTGRARQGSIRAPNWVGGGTVFGPIPRSYEQDVPRKVKLLARKSALNARARENSLFVIDVFNYDAPSTAKLRSLLSRLELQRRKVVVLTDGLKKNVYLSGRNLPDVLVMPFDEVSTYHLLWAHVVLVEGSALGHELAPVAEREAAAPARRAPARKAKAEKAPVASRGKKAAKSTSGKAKKSSTPAKTRSAAKKAPGKASTARKNAAKKPAKPRRKEK
jgi:large subunit ribosomal protein L4